MSRSPTAKISFEQLPSDAKERHEAFIDLFGQHVFSLRNQVADAVEQILACPELRDKLGRIPAEPYDEVARLDAHAQEKAKALARTAIDRFIKEMLALFMNRGTGTRIGEDHCIRYDVNLEIHRIPREEQPEREQELDTLVEFDTINVGGRKAFLDYFATWVLHHDHHK